MFKPSLVTVSGAETVCSIECVGVCFVQFDP